MGERESGAPMKSDSVLNTMDEGVSSESTQALSPCIANKQVRARISPLPCARLSAEQMVIANTLSRVTMPLRTGLEKFYASIRLSTTIAPRRFIPCCTVSVIMGGNTFTTYLDAAMLNEQGGRYIPVEHLATLPSNLRQSLLEAALDVPLSALERAMGEGVKVIRVEAHDGVSTPTQGFYISSDDVIASGIAFVAVDNALVQWFVQGAQRLQVRNPNRTDSLPLSAHFELGTSAVPIAEMRSVTPGDLILLDQTPTLQPMPIRVRFSDTLSCRAILEPDRVRITHPLEESMADNTDTPVAENSGVEQLEVVLSFDVGKTTLTVAELKTLAPEHVFELGARSDKPIAIRVGGQLIGTGELVQISDRLGVRVLELSESFDGKYT